MSYDSTQDTEEHIQKVHSRLVEVQRELLTRALVHDASKLKEPEKSGYDKLTAKLADLVYGSPEYKQALADAKPVIDHHYAHNSHHPEHWPVPESEEIDALRADILAFRQVKEVDGELFQRLVGYLEQTLIDMQSQVNGMSLLDLVEMVCDWKAASERTKQGSIEQSLAHNINRFGIDPQLASILYNTVKELGW
jgi:hypothetical protein